MHSLLTYCLDRPSNVPRWLDRYWRCGDRIYILVTYSACSICSSHRCGGVSDLIATDYNGKIENGYASTCRLAFVLCSILLNHVLNFQLSKTSICIKDWGTLLNSYEQQDSIVDISCLQPPLVLGIPLTEPWSDESCISSPPLDTLVAWTLIP
jgi:hypothetical protein